MERETDTHFPKYIIRILIKTLGKIINKPQLYLKHKKELRGVHTHPHMNYTSWKIVEAPGNLALKSH